MRLEIDVPREMYHNILRGTNLVHNGVYKSDLIKIIQDALPIPTEHSDKEGHWIRKESWSEGYGMGESYGYHYMCSECDNKVKGGYSECGDKYCPECGAKMYMG